jgi:hypothetical protein
MGSKPTLSTLGIRHPLKTSLAWGGFCYVPVTIHQERRLFFVIR